jgi:hypothetical protein
VAQGGAVEAQGVELLAQGAGPAGEEVGSVMLIGASGQQVGVHGYRVVQDHKAACEHQ